MTKHDHTRAFKNTNRLVYFDLKATFNFGMYIRLRVQTTVYSYYDSVLCAKCLDLEKLTVCSLMRKWGIASCKQC